MGIATLHPSYGLLDLIPILKAIVNGVAGLTHEPVAYRKKLLLAARQARVVEKSDAVFG